MQLLPQGTPKTLEGKVKQYLYHSKFRVFAAGTTKSFSASLKREIPEAHHRSDLMQAVEFDPPCGGVEI
jgi:hypothetical protein